MNLNTCILIVVLPLVIVPVAWAQTLFERCSDCRVNPFTNVVARSRGDLLVVLIRENTDVENIDERSLDRTATSALGGAVNYNVTGGLGTGIGTGNVGQTGNSSRSFNGDSEFRSERQLQDRFTVTVVDVLPNGNMLIAGKRRVLLQGDVRTLQLTGTVRAVDVLPNNSVSSQLIGNLDIRLLADGPEEEFSKQGWLGRRLNRWLPF